MVCKKEMNRWTWKYQELHISTWHSKEPMQTKQWRNKKKNKKKIEREQRLIATATTTTATSTAAQECLKMKATINDQKGKNS